MAENVVLLGRIMDASGNGIAGLIVEAWDKDHIIKDDALGLDRTRAHGVFTIEVNESAHKEAMLDKNPDVYFKIYYHTDLIYSTENEPASNVKGVHAREIKLPKDALAKLMKLEITKGMVGIYGGGPLQDQENITSLKQSGFNTVVCWSVHVNADGDLIYNDPPSICSNGAYTGPSEWPTMLADLMTAPTTVETLIFSVGSGGSNDFKNIGDLINQQGIGPESILYKNFSALKQAIPQISVIDFDNEDYYNENTVVQFARMLDEIGFSVTFCPYFNSSFWIECLEKINMNGKHIVTGFNLQCYSGGGGNASLQALESEWIRPIAQGMGWSHGDAAAFVRPGLWCVHGDGCQSGPDSRCPSNIQSTLASWKSLGITGGWIWLYDDVLKCEGSNGCNGEVMTAEAYAAAIVNGLTIMVEEV